MRSNRYHFDEATLKEGHRLHTWERKPIHVYSDAAGVYRCQHCGCSWQAERVWAWWPVSVRLVRSWRFGRHGVEVGCDGIERPIFAQVWSLGPLRIVLGAAKEAAGG